MLSLKSVHKAQYWEARTLHRWYIWRRTMGASEPLAETTGGKHHAKISRRVSSGSLWIRQSVDCCWRMIGEELCEAATLLVSDIPEEIEGIKTEKLLYVLGEVER